MSNPKDIWRSVYGEQTVDDIMFPINILAIDSLSNFIDI